MMKTLYFFFLSFLILGLTGSSCDNMAHPQNGPSADKPLVNHSKGNETDLHNDVPDSPNGPSNQQTRHGNTDEPPRPRYEGKNPPLPRQDPLPFSSPPPAHQHPEPPAAAKKRVAFVYTFTKISNAEKTKKTLNMTTPFAWDFLEYEPRIALNEYDCVIVGHRGVIREIPKLVKEAMNLRFNSSWEGKGNWGIMIMVRGPGADLSRIIEVMQPAFQPLSVGALTFTSDDEQRSHDKLDSALPLRELANKICKSTN